MSAQGKWPKVRGDMEVDISIRTDNVIVARRVRVIPESGDQSDRDLAVYGIDLVKQEIAAMLRGAELTEAASRA